MNAFFRILRGEFRPRELRPYLAIETVVFWGVIFQCWRMFPEENSFSIMTHTFSFLGSFNSDRNPEGWWLFTVALCFWGVATVPLALYIRRSIKEVSPWAARIGGGLLLVGALGVVLVGTMPDARAIAVGSLKWGELHKFAALVLVVGYLFGIPLIGYGLLRELLAPKTSISVTTRHLLPYGFFVLVSATSLAFLTRWLFVYADMKTHAQITGVDVGSSWSEALGTRYSFPLWDNVFIYTLFITLSWMALAAPSIMRERQG